MLHYPEFFQVREDQKLDQDSITQNRSRFTLLTLNLPDVWAQWKHLEAPRQKVFWRGTLLLCESIPFYLQSRRFRATWKVVVSYIFWESPLFCTEKSWIRLLFWAVHFYFQFQYSELHLHLLNEVWHQVLCKMVM